MLRRIVVCFLVNCWIVCAAPPPGESLFLSNCAFCHAVNGHGGRGPSLVSVRVTQNTTDDAIKNIIKAGIPGTGMPGFDLEPDDLNFLVAYIRNLGGVAGPPGAPIGDSARGRDLYAARGCAGCHRIGNVGSIFGPELTRIGAARSPEYLRESILNPSADISPDYEGVAVITPEGKRLEGIRINEDTFTVQLRLPDQQFAMFDKAELRSTEALTVSLMPAFRQVSEKDLNDLVAYLQTLTSDAAGSDITKAAGVH